MALVDTNDDQWNKIQDNVTSIEIKILKITDTELLDRSNRSNIILINFLMETVNNMKLKKKKKVMSKWWAELKIQSMTSSTRI